MGQPFAWRRDVAWFQHHCIDPVQERHRRPRCLPGYMLICGNMAIRPDRHLSAHWENV
ncbi:hypothetical protein JQ569_28435 [Bradyrhizobium elkanii]|nr:hypothetical protein [Bradyrhizobium elkanii]